jgi:hypothetical protein
MLDNPRRPLDRAAVRLGLVSDLFLSNTLSPSAALPEHGGNDHWGAARGCAGRNASERRANLEKDDAQAAAIQQY